LVENGLVHTRQLYTIRKGELARDQIRGGLVRVDSELIKIKGHGRSWTCLFLGEDSHRCRIYAHRPLECRELKCWDTSRIEQVYDRGRLDRRALLSGIQGLWELVVEHERRCGYDRLRNWLQSKNGSRAQEARARLSESKTFDVELRKLLVARGCVEPGQLDFLLGRPVEMVLRIEQRAECRTPGDQIPKDAK
jgi:hypothetical protein